MPKFSAGKICIAMVHINKDWRSKDVSFHTQFSNNTSIREWPNYKCMNSSDMVVLQFKNNAIRKKTNSRIMVLHSSLSLFFCYFPGLNPIDWNMEYTISIKKENSLNKKSMPLIMYGLKTSYQKSDPFQEVINQKTKMLVFLPVLIVFCFKHRSLPWNMNSSKINDRQTIWQEKE